MFLPLVMLAVLLVVVAGTLTLLAHAILHPPRMTDGKAAYVLKRLSPGDLAMRFEPARFEVRDEHAGKPLSIAGWWIPHPSGGDRTVVFVHGYADAKVGSIAWAPTWQSLGYHILAIDLRAHGESGGRYTTAGVFERHDLDQVINELRAARPQQTRRLVLFGVSMGTAVVLATEHLRNDIDAMVLDCPFVHFRAGALRQVQLLGLPLPGLLPGTLWIAKRMSGADFDQIQPLELMGSAKCPLLVIHSGNDQFVPPEDAAQIESVLASRSAERGPSEYWLVPDIAHLMALPADPEEYARRLGDFLQRANNRFASSASHALS
jgi:alpha-beta hydrolase superfamily lysophospholipase